MLIATRSGKINISKEKDTKLVAERLSKLINLGDFILLNGNLGVGKTTFTKYIINSLQRINRQQISEVPSPTFNITNEYQIKKILIKHYDLYRIKNEKELNNLGIQENLKKQITLIEWPEIVKKLKIDNGLNLPELRIFLSLFQKNFEFSFLLKFSFS